MNCKISGEFTSGSPEQTIDIAKKFAAGLSGGEIIMYTGNLGAGKTTFTKGILGGLNYSEYITSPTFSIVNEYNAGLKVYHFDMYRIQTEDDLISTGFFDLLEQENAVFIIEWSENISEFFKPEHIHIDIQYGNNEDERIIRILKNEI